ncbi:MAG: sigma-70 family RNA polymerase sigma factor [Caldilineaceae bacterium]
MDTPKSLTPVQTAVRGLIQRYDWTLLTEDELCREAQQVIAPEQRAAEVEKLVTGCYAKALYTACCQIDDSARREAAYIELRRFLYVNAQKRDPIEAEDLAQAALQLVIVQLDQCHTPTAFFTFAIFKLLQVIKELRRRQAKAQQYGDDETEVERVIEPQQQKLVDRLTREEGWALLLNAVADLPNERQRSVVLLKYVEELSDEEIAQQLGITANNVRVLRTRALSTLRSNPALRAYFLDE